MAQAPAVKAPIRRAVDPAEWGGHTPVILIALELLAPGNNRAAQLSNGSVSCGALSATSIQDAPSLAEMATPPHASSPCECAAATGNNGLRWEWQDCFRFCEVRLGDYYRTSFRFAEEAAERYSLPVFAHAIDVESQRCYCIFGAPDFSWAGKHYNLGTAQKKPRLVCWGRVKVHDYARPNIALRPLVTN